MSGPSSADYSSGSALFYQPQAQGTPPISGGSPEATFRASVNRSLWLAVLIAGLTALLLALVWVCCTLDQARQIRFYPSSRCTGILHGLGDEVGA